MDSFLDKFIRWLRFRKVVKHIPKDSIICDIGCGRDAYFLKHISSSIKQGIGLDEEVESHEDPKLEFKKLKINKDIPLEKESFDAVTLMAVLEHLSHPQEVLKESFRILKPGGRLILTTPSPLAKPILEFLALLQLIDRKEIRDHKNYFWPDEVKEMLIRAGFKKEGIKNYYFAGYLNSLIIAQK
jgi:2-polyprenyl-3-methyl-5-hydroxy-6-metoxy-1,4-benzoquinol methylase